jgi:lipopolysaccharide/colanic/teichoic acid biosynthesis glycosyltransferase
MIKRIFDFSFSFIGLIVLSPLLFFIFLAIKIDSIGPVLFSQKRVGKDGELFTLVKFRSMNLKQNSNSTTTTHGDVRITKIGEFLRKYKLDELPELWNVIKGDMSLVGPRPDVPGYADFLRGEDRNILKLKPGITGPASLKYANEEEILARQENPKEYNDKIIYPDKVRINLDYYYQSNLWIDIKIIFATIFRISY